MTWLPRVVFAKCIHTLCFLVFVPVDALTHVARGHVPGKEEDRRCADRGGHGRGSQATKYRHRGDAFCGSFLYMLRFDCCIPWLVLCFCCCCWLRMSHGTHVHSVAQNGIICRVIALVHGNILERSSWREHMGSIFGGTCLEPAIIAASSIKWICPQLWLKNQSSLCSILACSPSVFSFSHLLVFSHGNLYKYRVTPVMAHSLTHSLMFSLTSGRWCHLLFAKVA